MAAARRIKSQSTSKVYCENTRNRFGLALVVLYLLFTLGTVIYVKACPIIYCKAWIVLPILPWAAFFEEIARASIITYLGLVLFNAAIVYLIGVAIGKFFNLFWK